MASCTYDVEHRFNVESNLHSWGSVLFHGFFLTAVYAARHRCLSRNIPPVATLVIHDIGRDARKHQCHEKQ